MDTAHSVRGVAAMRALGSLTQDLLENIFGSSTKSGPTKCSAIGHPTRSTSGARRRWRRQRRPWSNMDRLEIADHGATGEAFFRDSREKWLLGTGTDKMAITGGRHYTLSRPFFCPKDGVHPRHWRDVSN